jgi:hypothetical protein
LATSLQVSNSGRVFSIGQNAVNIDIHDRNHTPGSFGAIDIERYP